MPNILMIAIGGMFIFMAMYWFTPMKYNEKFRGLVSLLSSMGVIVLVASLAFNFYETNRRWERDRMLSLTTLTQDDWIKFEQLFLSNPRLNSVYRNFNACYKDLTDAEIDAIHVYSIIVQIMDDVFKIESLSSSASDSEIYGWICAFRSWFQDPGLQRWWPTLKRNYGTDFIDFVEKNVISQPVCGE